jgi:hypothetical protein
MTELALILGGRAVLASIHTAIVAGWTGRNRAAVEEHIAELEALGVARPSSAPIFYRVSASRLTTAPEIESTEASSGEVEPVLLRHAGALWVGVGSDHTDRKLETYSVAASKQLCDKPIARELWPYVDVAPHWDRLILRSWITTEAAEHAYQDATLAGLLHPDDLMAGAKPPLDDGTLMFCGTVPVEGGIRPASVFRYELHDPLLGRTIASRYTVRLLPVIN